jgi:hypothetical protein
MEFHLAMEVEANQRSGLPQAESERLARIRIGSIPEAMENVRDARRLGWLEGSAGDLRQAWRALRRRPGYLLIGLTVLSAAVAVNTLVFAILYGVLLRPLPYPEPERLVRLYESSTFQPKFPLSIYHFQQNIQSSRTLESQALYTQSDMQFLHEERAEMVTAVAISDQFFRVLGASPVLGRGFLPAEMLRAARVVVLSHEFWTRRLKADPGVVGRTIRLDREEWTVVGIAPRGFEHVGGEFRSPLQGSTVAIWRPLPMDVNPRSARASHYTNAVARLKPGVTVEEARQDLNGILTQLGAVVLGSGGEFAIHGGDSGDRRQQRAGSGVSQHRGTRHRPDACTAAGAGGAGGAGRRGFASAARGACGKRGAGSMGGGTRSGRGGGGVSDAALVGSPGVSSRARDRAAHARGAILDRGGSRHQHDRGLGGGASGGARRSGASLARRFANVGGLALQHAIPRRAGGRADDAGLRAVLCGRAVAQKLAQPGPARSRFSSVGRIDIRADVPAERL